MNKKAQASTFLPYLLIGLVVVFIFAIVVVPIAYTSDEILDELKGIDQVKDSNISKKRITQVQNLITPAFDQLVFVILIAIVLGSLVISIFTDYHPVVLGVMVLAIIFLVLIAGLFVNVYDEVRGNEIIEAKSAEFTFTNVIMGSQLPIIIAFIGVISIIILLSKRGGQTAPV